MSQSMLFAALAFSSKTAAPIVLLVVPLVGAISSVIIRFSINAAVDSLKGYRESLKNLKENEICNDTIKARYFQFERKPEIIEKGYLAPRYLPWVFIISWIVVFLLVIINLPKIFNF